MPRKVGATRVPGRPSFGRPAPVTVVAYIQQLTRFSQRARESAVATVGVSVCAGGLTQGRTKPAQAAATRGCRAPDCSCRTAHYWVAPSRDLFGLAGPPPPRTPPRDLFCQHRRRAGNLGMWVAVLRVVTVGGDVSRHPRPTLSGGRSMDRMVLSPPPLRAFRSGPTVWRLSRRRLVPRCYRHRPPRSSLELSGVGRVAHTGNEAMGRSCGRAGLQPTGSLSRAHRWHSARRPLARASPPDAADERHGRSPASGRGSLADGLAVWTGEGGPAPPGEDEATDLCQSNVAPAAQGLLFFVPNHQPLCCSDPVLAGSGEWSGMERTVTAWSRGVQWRAGAKR